MSVAVLPYYVVPPIEIGPVDLQPFGIAVAIGVLLGAHLARRHGERTGLDLDILHGMIGWVAVVGFIGSHIFDVLAYQPEAIVEDPLIFFKLWAGISSVGGMIGGLVGMELFWRRSGAHKRGLSRMRYVDSLILGIIVGYLFGRLGCTLVHDHPGLKSDFFLAFAFPDGPRHDLGFYEFLALIVIFGAVFFASRKDRPVGWLTGFAAVLYGPIRFGLDFLRIEDAAGADPRYLGLTPAHYISIGILALGVFLMWRSRARDVGVTPSWLDERARERERELREAERSGGDSGAPAKAAPSKGKPQSKSKRKGKGKD